MSAYQITRAINKHPIPECINISSLKELIYYRLEKYIEIDKYVQSISSVEYIVNVTKNMFMKYKRLRRELKHELMEEVINEMIREMNDVEDIPDFTLVYKRFDDDVRTRQSYSNTGEELNYSYEDSENKEDHQQCCCSCKHKLGEVILRYERPLII